MNISTKSKQKSVPIAIGLLKIHYKEAKIALRYSNTWELLVAVVLSAQCTDVMVNKVTSQLFLKYTTLDDYAQADIKEFEKDIKSTGFFHNKAKNILAAAHLVKNSFSSKVPDTMDELLTIPGVARKTANVVLGTAFGKAVGIAVDTHVSRISQRLRLVSLDSIGGKTILYFSNKGIEIVDYKKDANPVKIEAELMNVIPKNEWIFFTYRIIEHGRKVCKAQNPDCAHCFLRDICPSSRI
jgi:endonuclease III